MVAPPNLRRPLGAMLMAIGAAVAVFGALYSFNIPTFAVAAATDVHLLVVAPYLLAGGVGAFVLGFFVR